MKSNIEYINAIIAESLRTGTDITPGQRKEWALFACALKVLGFSESDFVALSNLHGTPERESRKVWRAERNPKNYVRSEEQAIKKILYFAKRAGMDLKRVKPNSYFCRSWKRPGTRLRKSLEVPQPPVYVRMDIINTSATNAPLSSLFQFLCRVFPQVEVKTVCEKYKVGTTVEFGKMPGRMGSAFPYIDSHNRVVDVKLMAYDENGHRRKDGYSMNWLLAKLKQNDRRGDWPLFGEHLLAHYPTMPVAVVESEKTALIASMVIKGYIWVATGSKQNLNPNRLTALKGRVIILWPDADASDDWRRTGEALARKGYRIKCADNVIREYAIEPKDDIADIILRASIRPTLSTEIMRF